MISVNIKSNPLRLLAETFLYIHLVKEKVFARDQAYPICLDGGETIGSAVCIRQYTTTLIELNDIVMLLADGNTHFVQYARDNKAYNHAQVQVCTFRCTHRSDTSFTRLIDRECPKAGITITRQSSLF